MMKVFFTRSAAMLFVATLFLSTVPARADGISDSFTVFGPLDSSGNRAVVASVSVDQATEDTFTVYIIPDSSLVNFTEYSDATLLLDPSHVASDIFGVVPQGAVPGCNGPFCLGFVSDQDSIGHLGAFVFGGFNPAPEGNGVFDATKYLNPALIAGGDTAQFVSDTADSAVPEPASWALLTSALIAVLLCSRRRIRA